jgi:hypothetical protein
MCRRAGYGRLDVPACRPAGWFRGRMVIPDGLERRVEHGQVCRPVQVERALEQVDRRGPGQHRAVDVGAMVEEVLLDGERSHAVAEQDQRQVPKRLGGCSAELRREARGGATTDEATVGRGPEPARVSPLSVSAASRSATTGGRSRWLF